MKNTLMALILFLSIMLPNYCYSGNGVDFSSSTLMNKGTETITLNNVIVNNPLGGNTSYWVKFKFDLASTSFIVVDADVNSSAPPEAAQDTPLTLNDITGNYTLKDFKVVYSDGSTFDTNDAYGFSGTMTIAGDGTLLQKITLNGQPINLSGKLESVGADYIQITSLGCTYNLGIELSGSTLTTKLSMGTCGYTFSETDVWEKTSLASLKSVEEGTENKESVIGGMFGVVWNQ